MTSTMTFKQACERIYELVSAGMGESQVVRQLFDEGYRKRKKPNEMLALNSVDPMFREGEMLANGTWDEWNRKRNIRKSKQSKKKRKQINKWHQAVTPPPSRQAVTTTPVTIAPDLNAVAVLAQQWQQLTTQQKGIFALLTTNS